MEYGAIDLHTRRSQIRIISEDGAVVLERRIDTRAHEFARVFGGRPRMRILLETGTESEWVAQSLEPLGHEVIVADTTDAAMYGSRTRRVKTDRRDVAALADACRRGIYRPAHRVAPATQIRRQHLRTREHLIRMRTQTMNALRALLRQAGHRVPSGTTRTFVHRVAAVELAPDLHAVMAPLMEALERLAPLIDQADRWVRETAAADPVAPRLMTVPGVGGVVALSYQTALETPARFGGDAGRASAYLGLVPSEHSSGEGHRKGAITKAGPRMVRSLLVQAAWTLWRQRRRVPRLYAWVSKWPPDAGGALRSPRSPDASVGSCMPSGGIRRCFGLRRSRPNSSRGVGSRMGTSARGFAWLVRAVPEMSRRPRHPHADTAPDRAAVHDERE